MDTRPGKDFVLDLLLPLFKGAEFLIVAVKVLEQFFKSISDVLINPWSVLQLNYEVKSVDHAQMVQALFVFFKIIEEHHNNAHNLLFVEVVKHLAR